jgi:single-stranded DNA-binding protein
MASNLNFVVLSGNLLADPQRIEHEGGSLIATASLANNEEWQDGEGKQRQRLNTLGLVAHGKHAEKLLACPAGTSITIHGRAQTSETAGPRGGVVKKTKFRITTLFRE